MIASGTVYLMGCFITGIGGHNSKAAVFKLRKCLVTMYTDESVSEGPLRDRSSCIPCEAALIH